MGNLYLSIQNLQKRLAIEVLPDVTLTVCSPEDLLIYKLISTRLRDHEDANGVIRRQSDLLDTAYVLDWLRQFESALDDSTLIATFRRMRHRPEM